MKLISILPRPALLVNPHEACVGVRGGQGRAVGLPLPALRSSGLLWRHGPLWLSPGPKYRTCRCRLPPVPTALSECSDSLQALVDPGATWCLPFPQVEGCLLARGDVVWRWALRAHAGGECGRGYRVGSVELRHGMKCMDNPRCVLQGYAGGLCDQIERSQVLRQRGHWVRPVIACTLRAEA